MDSFSTQFTSSNAGLLRAVPFIQRALKLGGGAVTLPFFLAGFVSFFLAGFVGALLPRVWPGHPVVLPLIIGAAIFLALTFGAVMPFIRARTARRFDQLLPPVLTRLAADESGVTISDAHSHGHWDWSHIRGAVATPDGIAILMGYSGLFVPKSAFANTVEKASVIELINRRADRSSI